MTNYPPYKIYTLLQHTNVTYSSGTVMNNSLDAVDKLDAILKLLEKDLGFFDPDCELSDGYVHPAINTKHRHRLLSNIRGSMLDLLIDILDEEDK